jgi:hypothetical protein
MWMPRSTPLADEETHRTLYGAADGTWLVLERTADVGLVSPPQITIGGRSLLCLGATYDVVASVYAALVERFAGSAGRQGGRGSGADVQQVMAEILGVGQQAVSRYVNKGTEPRLKPAGWQQLVRACFETRQL